MFSIFIWDTVYPVNIYFNGWQRLRHWERSIHRYGERKHCRGLSSSLCILLGNNSPWEHSLHCPWRCSKWAWSQQESTFHPTPVSLWGSGCICTDGSEANQKHKPSVEGKTKTVARQSTWWIGFISWSQLHINPLSSCILRTYLPTASTTAAILGSIFL